MKRKCASMLFGVAALVLPGQVHAVTCDLIASGETPSFRRSPIDGVVAQLISGFGFRTNPNTGEKILHSGIDWAGPAGSAVFAAEKGIVKSVDAVGAWEGRFRVVVDHGARWSTAYVHLGVALVKPGDCLKRGEALGRLVEVGGKPDYEILPHVEFQVLKNDQFINPLELVISRAPVDAGVKP